MQDTKRNMPRQEPDTIGIHLRLPRQLVQWLDQQAAAAERDPQQRNGPRGAFIRGLLERERARQQRVKGRG